MEIPEQLRCLFSARIEEQDESYLIEVPAQELRLDNIQQGDREASSTLIRRLGFSAIISQILTMIRTQVRQRRGALVSIHHNVPYSYG